MAEAVSTRRLHGATNGLKHELTFEMIEAAEAPEHGTRYLRCGRMKGFGAFITANNARSYFVEGRIKGRGGSPIRVTLGPVERFKSFHVAKKLADNMLAKMTLGEHPKGATAEAGGITFADAFDAYLASRTLRPSTLRDYRVARAALDAWAQRKLASITAEEVRTEFLRLSAASSPNMASQHFRLFRALWHYTFAALDSPPRSPTDVLSVRRAKLWVKLKRRRRVIANEVFPKWWREVTKLPGRWPLYFKLQALTGSRKSELRLLLWSRVSADGSRIRFPSEDTKSHREIEIPLGSHAKRLLVAARKAKKSDRDRVFGAEVQHKRHVARIVKAVGTLWSSHDLRRMFRSAAMRAGVPDVMAKALLNHSLESDVSDGYADVTPADRATAMKRIERQILKAARVK
jgi:integrase